jgi:hypothetical protein
MLLGFWRILIEFLTQVFDRYRSAHAGSRYGSDRFDGSYLEINSPLITGSKERATSSSSKAVLLPKELKIVDHVRFSKQETENPPEFHDVIEVSYVEGEFLSKSLDARNNNSKRARTSFWLAGTLVAVVALVGIKSNLQTHYFKITPDNRVVSDNSSFENSSVGVGSRGEKALSELERPSKAATIAIAKPILQQGDNLPKTNMPSQNKEQIIPPIANDASHVGVKIGTVIGSEPVGNNKASGDDNTNGPRQADQVDRPNPTSRKSNSASHEGFSSVPKNIVSSRNQKDRTHPIRTVRSSASGVPETVVNGVLGGLAGAVVGGPVGLIAGATVGATAGRAIAHSWGLR